MADIKSIGGNPIVPESVAVGSVTDDMLAETGVKSNLVALRNLVWGTTSEVSDWGDIAAAADSEGDFLVGTRLTAPWATTGSTKTEYDMPWDVVHLASGTIQGQSDPLPLMYLQTHYCLPDATEFSPQQAFLYAVDGLPAGTYHVTLDADTYNRAAGDWQFTLTQALPAGGQLRGFFAAGQPAPVKAFASQTDKVATETCEVTAGSGGSSLGTFTTAGIPVPASGTPETAQTVTVGGTEYKYYGLNSSQRVSYGNNRCLHSPVRQWLNASGPNWWTPKTVFDCPPSYESHVGFLTYLDPGLVEVMQPVRREYALSYLCDGGTAANPVTDVLYDKVFLQCWEEGYLKVDSSYGGKAGLEGCGEAWEYWKRAKGTSAPPAAGTTNTEYIRLRLDNKTAAGVFLGSCSRNGGYGESCVYSTGNCGYCNASYAYRVVPACAIRKS